MKFITQIMECAYSLGNVLQGYTHKGITFSLHNNYNTITE